MLINQNLNDPREWMALPELQYGWLRRWAEGDFDPGTAQAAAATPSPAERAAALDRAALDDTTGGPFHPGVEFTWPMRQPLLFDPIHPFRIVRRLLPEPVLAAELTSSAALASGGPLDGSRAGDITRWMALPWQTDTASCLSAYELASDEYLPTFWPARVPNDVVTDENYRTILDRGASLADRHAALSVERRRKWLRGFSYAETDTARPRFLPLSERFVTAWPTIALVRPSGADRRARVPCRRLRRDRTLATGRRHSGDRGRRRAPGRRGRGGRAAASSFQKPPDLADLI